MSSTWDAREISIDATTASFILPPVICYFVGAALAVIPNTRAARVALWLVAGLLALRAILFVDMSQPGQKLFNVSLVYYMFSIVLRTLDWTVTTEPFVRHLRPKNSSPSIVMDALDLATSLRYHSWNLSRGVYVAQETRPTDRISFSLSTFLSLVLHAFVCGVYHKAVLSFAGDGPIANGFTIFDDTLPFLTRYLRASVISIFAAFSGYASMQMGYDLYTLLGVLFIGQDPAQWPPSFEAPWRATSLNEFWGRRWHQWNRHILVLFGGYPFSIFFGRAGLIIGTFLASGIMHDLLLVSLSGKSEAWRMLVGFGMMAPGILGERAFYRLTGNKVEGLIGWVWTMTWLVLWGTVLTEGCARAGGFGDSSLIDIMVPVRDLVERLVTGFDVWLHAI